jgi:hypothetical protein
MSSTTPISRRLTVAAPAHAITISRAAEILGEDEELLWDLATDMEKTVAWPAPADLAPHAAAVPGELADRPAESIQIGHADMWVKLDSTLLIGARNRGTRPASGGCRKVFPRGPA